MKNLQELPQLKDSISYVYLEHAIIEREDSAIVAINKEGTIPIPVSSVTCLLLGPGTSITHAAISAIVENGCMAIWCGEKGMRFYAAGLGETRSSRNLLRQAEVCMNEDLHMQAVRRMYAIRFPGIDTSGMTLQQLRGMEGMRVRKAYQAASKRYGIKWNKRDYKQDWDDNDAVNRALSSANAMLYGLCHAAVVSLGYSPGLGFIHVGKALSFVYDVADLYKPETTIPAAFAAVHDGTDDLEKRVRIRCRDEIAAARILSRIAKDIAYILSDDVKENDNAAAPGNLWDKDGVRHEGGRNYDQGKWEQ